MQHTAHTIASLRDTDALLISYPRSGNSWARLVLATAVILETERFMLKKLSVSKVTAALIPDLYIRRLDRNFQRQLGVRSVFKTHDWIGGNSNPVLYLFRRPEDVLASYFHFASTRGDIPAELTIDVFAEGNLQGWKTHVMKAMDRLREHDASILPISYELLLSRPVEGFMRMLTWLDLPGSELAVRKSLRLNSFHRTRKRLSNNGHFPMLQGKVGVGMSMLGAKTLAQIRTIGDPVYYQLIRLENGGTWDRAGED